MTRTSTPADERFWRKVDRRGVNDCWNWIGGIDRHGYGQFSDTSKRSYRAHRFSYQLLVGNLCDDLVIDHLCRNRACVNPLHLEQVTLAVNMARSPVYEKQSKKYAEMTHCRRGHPRTAENIRLNTDGGRVCRECRRINARHRYANREVHG